MGKRELALLNCCLYLEMKENETTEEVESRLLNLLSQVDIEILDEYNLEVREI